MQVPPSSIVSNREDRFFFKQLSLLLSLLFHPHCDSLSTVFFFVLLFFFFCPESVLTNDHIVGSPLLYKRSRDPAKIISRKSWQPERMRWWVHCLAVWTSGSQGRFQTFLWQQAITRTLQLQCFHWAQSWDEILSSTKTVALQFF